jgi:hypothetical protein
MHMQTKLFEIISVGLGVINQQMVIHSGFVKHTRLEFTIYLCS